MKLPWNNPRQISGVGGGGGGGGGGASALLLAVAGRVGDSLYSEAARLLDGGEQLVVQFVVVLVGRNVNPVKTGGGAKRGTDFKVTLEDWNQYTAAYL